MDGFENIEKHVAVMLNEHHNKQFQIFIEEIYPAVKISGKFSPMTEREPYGQNPDQIDGGENRFVILACRQAIMTFVQEVGIGGCTNLLILQKLTGEFSKGQAFKISDVIAGLKSPQVILASHAKELEGVADRVLRVERGERVSHATRRGYLCE